MYLIKTTRNIIISNNNSGRSCKQHKTNICLLNILYCFNFNPYNLNKEKYKNH